MPAFQAPPCPNCADRSAQLISERRADLNGSFFAPSAGGPPQMIYVYKCHCGAVFTHTAFIRVPEASATGAQQGSA